MITFDSSSALTCSQCKRGFEPEEKRRHFIELDQKNNVVKFEMIHVEECLELMQSKEEQAVLSRIGPMEFSSYAEARKHVPDLLELALAYPTCSIHVCSNNSYVLDLPVLPLVPIQLDFAEYKALFTVIFIDALSLRGTRAGEFPLAMFFEVKKQTMSTACFSWIHQVQGTNNEFMLVSVLQPFERDLKDRFLSYQNPHGIKHWQDTKIAEDNKDLTDYGVKVDQSMNQIYNACIDSALKLGLTLAPFNAECTSLAQTNNGVKKTIRHEMNIQSCNKRKDGFYVLPHPDIFQEDKTPIWHYKTNNTKDSVPLFYNTKDIEKELNKRHTKQPLTNYYNLLAYYPRSATVVSKN